MMPTREQWLASGFLGILAYVYTFGHGTPCTTYDHFWLGSLLTYGVMGLSGWIVLDMIADWIIYAIMRVRRGA